jgi:triosephosphate isomerase
MKTNVRRKFIVANWKMHTTSFEAQQLVKGIINGFATPDHVTVIICPPFPYLPIVGDMLRGSRILLGAQNMYPESEGAFTGEVSPTMLLDLNCKYVIVGHSERRHKLGESDAFINRKVTCALTSGLQVILCVGETLKERQSGQTEAVLDRQLSTGLAGVTPETLANVSVAYEPVWAIGNNEHHATPQEAHDTHVLIRNKLGQMLGVTWAEKLTVSYGGSVEPGNAAEFLGKDGIDGVLIGGASLKADEFLAIINAGICETEAELEST